MRRRRAERKRGRHMTKSTPVPIDGRDVILRDKYRAIVAEYSSEIVEILQAVKYDTEADTARLVKCVRHLDNARQQLLNIEVKLSYEESKSKETCGETCGRMVTTTTRAIGSPVARRPARLILWCARFAPARGLRMWKPPNFMATCAAMVSLMWTRPARLCSL